MFNHLNPKSSSLSDELVLAIGKEMFYRCVSDYKKAVKPLAIERVSLWRSVSHSFSTAPYIPPEVIMSIEVSLNYDLINFVNMVELLHWVCQI